MTTTSKVLSGRMFNEHANSWISKEEGSKPFMHFYGEIGQHRAALLAAGGKALGGNGLYVPLENVTPELLALPAEAYYPSVTDYTAGKTDFDPGMNGEKYIDYPRIIATYKGDAIQVIFNGWKSVQVKAESITVNRVTFWAYLNYELEGDSWKTTNLNMRRSGDYSGDVSGAARDKVRLLFSGILTDVLDKHPEYLRYGAAVEDNNKAYSLNDKIDRMERELESLKRERGQAVQRMAQTIQGGE